MFNEFICIFRRYCNLTQEDVAAAARIPLDRYREYEYGLDEPDNETLKRLAKIFGLEESIFSLGIEPISKIVAMFEPKSPDENMFRTAEERENVKLLINMLSKDEARLLLLYRTASRKHRNRIMQTALKSMSAIDAVTEDEIDEYLLLLEGTYTHRTEKLAEEYNMSCEEANLKLKNIFDSKEWKQIKKEIENLIDTKIENMIKDEFDKLS